MTNIGLASDVYISRKVSAHVQMESKTTTRAMNCVRADLLVLIENRLHLNACVCCFQGWLPPYRAEVVGAWDGELVNIARAFGMLLNFNCALVLVPMFRAILTYLQVERHHEKGYASQRYFTSGSVLEGYIFDVCA